jgi:hypothetical protein
VSYALFERIHGHLAILGLALLLHPIATLPGDRAGTRRTAALAALALVGPFALGWAIYHDYRQDVKPALEPTVRGLFEIKEHLAALAVALVVAGAVAAHGQLDARKLARHLLLAAFCCGGVAGLLGIWVAGSR